jgi:hypothetical protein
MSSGHEHHGADLTHNLHTTARVRCPRVAERAGDVSAWRTRALIVAVVFGLISLLVFLAPRGKNHILRAYLLGYMTCFNFAGGGLAMLMLQYVSGGKWGLILRRPLEAMTRTMLGGRADVLPIVSDEAPLSVGAFPTQSSSLQAYKITG